MPIRNVDRKKWQAMRAIYEKLKHGSPLTFGEIKSQFNIEDRTLHRYLAELQGLGLIVYENGKYCAVENRIVFSNKAEYEVALKHSKTLFEKIMKNHYEEIPDEYIKWHPGVVLDYLAKEPENYSSLSQHLSYYEDFWKLFQNYCELVKKYDFPEIEVPGEAPGRVTKCHFAGLEVSPVVDSVVDGVAYCDSPELPIIYANIDGRNIEFIPRFRENGVNEETKRDFLKLIELRKILVKELLHIMWLVQNGVPLKGCCNACPGKHIKIKEENVNKSS